MTRLGSFSTPRALIALAAALSASAASGAALMGCLRTQPPAAYGFGALLHLVALATITVCAGYLAVVLAALLHDHRRGGRAASRCCPRALLPFLVALCSAGAVAATIGPVTASPADTTSDVVRSAGLPSLDRPLSVRIRASAPVSARRVVVRHGDSLWSLVRARHPRADDAVVAKHVEDWYRTNAQTIGADPDIIRPGMVLLVPTTGERR